MAIVKANAYGHGAVECARRLAAEGANWFGVATPEEGIELRQSGIAQPILCLGGFWEGQQFICIQHALTPVVYRLDMAEALDRVARDAGAVADVHVKIDTGMGRLGVRFDQAAEFAESLRQFKNIRVDGLMTHFAAADEPSRGLLTINQIKRFEDAVQAFRDRGYDPTYRHLANSAGIFSESSAWGNMVRPGGVLYGLWRDILAPVSTGSGPRSPSGQPDWGRGGSDGIEESSLPLNELNITSRSDLPYNFQPVMSLRSRITLLKWIPEGESIGYGCTYTTSRKTRVATLPIGYHDGYMRALSNRGRVIVRRTFAPVIGRISMDLTMIDVTETPGAELGDIVTLLGITDGDPALLITAEDLALTGGSLSYEVTCGIGERVARIHI